jgi:hypothetical protein
MLHIFNTKQIKMHKELLIQIKILILQHYKTKQLVFQVLVGQIVF